MTKNVGFGIMLTLAWAACVVADPPDASYRPFFWHGWGRVCPSIGCCPDDYARKPMPAICPLPGCGGVNDYCRKPLPCVPPNPCGGPDDYCRKPMPCLLCPPWSPYLHAGLVCHDDGRMAILYLYEAPGES